MTEIAIEHIQKENKFICNFEGHEAVLKYSLEKLETLERLNHPITIDFYSTFVPPEFRGKGIAEKLVRTGLAWAKQEGFEIKASCWYAAKFL